MCFIYFIPSNYQKMSKRPAEDQPETPTKKQRTNDDLESMKAQLDDLLKNAAEHHEETRIAAVDRAYDLEEELKTTQSSMYNINAQLNQVASDHADASRYLETFESSQTMKMMTKVGDYNAEGSIQIRTLKEDNQKIMETLVKLKGMKQTLFTKQQSLEFDLKALHESVQQIEQQYVNAEKEVLVITNLNEP
jgi:chromosome segregation ATPase